VDLISQHELTSILGRYREGLERLYGERLRGLYLFGSHARGDAEEGSDVDVLVILDEVESTWSEIQRTSELTAELSLEFGVTVCGVFTSERRWRARESGFLRSVQEEGVAV